MHNLKWRRCVRLTAKKRRRRRNRVTRITAGHAHRNGAMRLRANQQTKPDAVMAHDTTSPTYCPTGKSVRRSREAVSSPICKNILIFRNPKSV
jgi:hypothetical protein